MIDCIETSKDIELYRYVSLSKLMNIIEFEQLAFTRISTGWEDSWELPLSKLELLGKEGAVVQKHYHYTDDMFGQCWTMNGNSDAMWRIYSQDKQGVMLTTTLKSLIEMDKDLRGYIEKVFYYKNLQQGIEYIEKKRSYRRNIKMHI